MGKVKDGSPASKPAKVTKGGSSGDSKGRFAPFLANLVHTNLYKPLQGKQARLWTAVGLGLTILFGLRELWLTLDAQSSVSTSYGIPALLGVVLGWITFRLLQYPPFVEFLIATEAEMNKVSWTSREDLKRATTVVLVTVALMAVFLFGVDWVWSNLLQLIGVLRFRDTSALGSNA
ncbi:preprotein translocase subunit SecE [Tundrisphaera lichenicola]|uniref:preprotein translocase subunit SecE n=1 Tax=Tundrisphaera lichenicola TaxID=2029860 RepID=UPI003EBA5B71